MTQLFSVKVEGISYTDNVKSCDVSYAVGRIVNNASFDVDFIPSIMVGKNIVITHQDNIFNGFVVSYEKTSNLLYSVKCRSLGGKLAEPFFVDIGGVEFSTSSSELVNEYASKSGIPIHYEAVEVPFYGSWVASGSPDGELIKMGSIIGADIYDNGDGIYIVNPKPVNGVAKEIKDGDVIGFADIGDTILSDGTGYVVTKTAEPSTPSPEDPTTVYSKNTLRADIDRVTGRAKIYKNPSGLLDSYDGMTRISSFNELKVETTMMNHQTSMPLMGGVVSIKKVTLNGAVISNYHAKIGTGIIYFDIEQSGNLRVEYITSIEEFKMKISKTLDGLFYAISGTKGDTVLNEMGFLNEDTYNGDDRIDTGDETNGVPNRYYIPNGTKYVEGFDIYTEGNVTLDLYSGIDKIGLDGKITTTSGTFTMVEPARFTKTEDGKYRFYPSGGIAGVVDVTSLGVSIPYTTGSDNQMAGYIELDRYYLNTEVEYKYEGDKNTIKYPHSDKEQTLVIDENTEIPLDGGEDDQWDDPANFPCGYPADYPFNIPNILGVERDVCVGKQIAGMTNAINSKGYCYAHIVQDGIYEYDTSSIKEKSSITLRANSEGTL